MVKHLPGAGEFIRFNMLQEWVLGFGIEKARLVFRSTGVPDVWRDRRRVVESVALRESLFRICLFIKQLDCSLLR